MLALCFGRRLAFVLLAAAFIAAAAGTGSFVIGRVVAATIAGAAVTIDDFAFGPAALTVQRGTTVTWTNKDDEPHTVVNDASRPLWKSSALDTDDSFSFTFTEPGTYKYFCSIHPRMQGTVVVE